MRRVCSAAARCNLLICERCSRHWRDEWVREGHRMADSWYERVEVTDTVQPKKEPREQPDDPNVN